MLIAVPLQSSVLLRLGQIFANVAKLFCPFDQRPLATLLFCNRHRLVYKMICSAVSQFRSFLSLSLFGGLSLRPNHNGTPATHPLNGREMRELRRHQRESAQSPFVFVSERGAPLSASGFSRMVEREAMAADLGIKAHAHML